MTEIVLHVGAGAVLGAVYFTLLLAAVRLHVSGAVALRVAPLNATRFVIAGATLWAAAQEGPRALLLILLGFLAARFAVQRWAKQG